jgi:hypothetical protein
VELTIFVAALGFAAYRGAAWLLPSWQGAAARIAEAIIAIALAVCIGELLGLVGLMKEFPLLVAAVAVAVASWRLWRHQPITPLLAPSPPLA